MVAWRMVRQLPAPRLHLPFRPACPFTVARTSSRGHYRSTVRTHGKRAHRQPVCEAPESHEIRGFDGTTATGGAGG